MKPMMKEEVLRGLAAIAVAHSYFANICLNAIYIIENIKENEESITVIGENEQTSQEGSGAIISADPT